MTVPVYRVDNKITGLDRELIPDCLDDACCLKVDGEWRIAFGWYSLLGGEEVKWIAITDDQRRRLVTDRGDAAC
jgi:hypothetical protein